jgi:hypothetical protein
LLLYFERKKTNQLKEMERKAGKEEWRIWLMFWIKVL